MAQLSIFISYFYTQKRLIRCFYTSFMLFLVTFCKMRSLIRLFFVHLHRELKQVAHIRIIVGSTDAFLCKSVGTGLFA